MLLVTLALKTLLSISQNGISPITLNKQLDNHLNKDIINASSVLNVYHQACTTIGLQQKGTLQKGVTKGVVLSVFHQRSTKSGLLRMFK
jgi:hypothetical protein